jgi:hypothetical protein
VFHGHAHHGSAQGTTRSGTPVYNVCLPLLRHESEPRWYRLVELPAPPMDEVDRELAPAPDRAIAAPAPAPAKRP